MLNSAPRIKARPRESIVGPGMFPEELFLQLLCVERKRTERSGRRFVLMLLDPGSLLKPGRPNVLSNLLMALSQSTRDTDLKGWYQDGSILGVIFTEISTADDDPLVQALSVKITDSLERALTPAEVSEIKLSFHIFPEDWTDGPEHPVTSSLQMALAEEVNRKRISLMAKRLIDVGGSTVALLVSLPLLFLIALAIKLTSRGPILFRQVRLGRYGKKFTFLKFRSMYTNSDHKLHEDYVTRFITGARDVQQSNGSGPRSIYKLMSDPRITPLGRFLRSTSLDELPQFLNVIRGEMSLVGPRPPVVYEFSRYELWHKRRLVAVKPGITGLWQVDGRSRVRFDEMVRLDIRYARTWTIWLDLKILLQTPWAVLTGIGAC